MEHFGAKYEGPRVGRSHRLEGNGTYTFENGDHYIGGFKDGMFHGKGILYFKGNGFGKFEGEWKDGISVKGEYVFDDHLHYKEDDWHYCTRDDRRFFSEHKKGIRPNGLTQISTQDPPVDIPPGTLDTADGFFDPITGVVHLYKGGVRQPDQAEVEWIVAKCRRAVQSRPDTLQSLQEAAGKQ